MSEDLLSIPCHTESSIDAILFDMGGTLRQNIKRDFIEKASVIQRILDLLGFHGPATHFTKLLEAREASYEKWASENLIELNEIDFWTKWMLPEWPAGEIGPMAMLLNEIWREAIATRVLFPETRDTILELHRRGYRLAVVSNTTSSVDSPRTLQREGLSPYFDSIILSCVFGKRKPGADILLYAATCLNIEPGRCVYVGDRPDWDVIAARRAGFKLAIIRETHDQQSLTELIKEQTPDYYINDLLHLLEIFPEKSNSRR